MLGIPPEDLVAQLEQLGYRVTPPPAKPKPDRCTVCGRVDQDAFFNPNRYDIDVSADDTESAEWITKIRVEVGEQGEEGWDYRVLKLCEYHDSDIVKGLMDLGFKTHHHGSTHPLSDEDCHYGCSQQGSPYDDDYDGTYPA